jgi:GH25 family lysozyme M1 (1,4-beta-N-acetylmuramidase)
MLIYDDADDGQTEWTGPCIYQYTSTGHLDGWGGELDLDVFYGSQYDWVRLASKR